MQIPIRSAAIALAAALVASAGAQERETRERTIAVSVVSNDGTPVDGLTAKDFVVRENGLAREVVRVAPASPPSHIALLIDDSQATQNTTAFLRPALTAFVKTVAAADPAPHVALWTFGERPTRRVNFTPNPAAIEQEIPRIIPVTSAGAYLLEAIGEAVKELRTRQAERPVIVAFVAERGPEFSTILEKQITEAVRTIGASLWTVTLEGNGQPLTSTEHRERARVLGETTSLSGGTNDVILTPQALESAFARIGRALTSRYAVTYGRPDSLIPPDRIDVEVRRPDVQVRASRWAGQ
jgi:hypothetical protein